LCIDVSCIIVLHAFLVILSMWLSQFKLLWIFSPRYLAESAWFNTWPWMVYSLWIGDFLFVAMSISHLSGLNLINQLFSHCCKLSKSLCRMAWSSGSDTSIQKTVICKHSGGWWDDRWQVVIEK
jgi:hypothetical protein